jgi:hypothetical protein
VCSEVPGDRAEDFRAVLGVVWCRPTLTHQHHSVSFIFPSWTCGCCVCSMTHMCSVILCACVLSTHSCFMTWPSGQRDAPVCQRLHVWAKAVAVNRLFVPTCCRLHEIVVREHIVVDCCVTLVAHSSRAKCLEPPSRAGVGTVQSLNLFIYLSLIWYSLQQGCDCIKSAISTIISTVNMG